MKVVLLLAYSKFICCEQIQVLLHTHTLYKNKLFLFNFQCLFQVQFKRLKTQHDSREEKDAANETGELSEEQESLSEQRIEDDSRAQLSATINTIVTDDVQQDCMKKCFKPRLTSQYISATPRELRLQSPSEVTPVTQENEFDIFGKHVATQLKQLKVEYAVTAIGEINKILTGKRLASLLGSANHNNIENNYTVHDNE